MRARRTATRDVLVLDVRLELPILAPNRRFGNVALRQRSDSRMTNLLLTPSGAKTRPTSYQP
jgi:hypothetical protein